MNKKVIINSILYSQDVVHIVKEYLDTMDFYFSNLDNQIAHDFCYTEYKKFVDLLESQARERGLKK